MNKLAVRVLVVVLACSTSGALAGIGPAHAEGAPAAPAAPSAAEGDRLLGTDQLIVQPASGQTVTESELSDAAGEPVDVVRKRDGGSYVVKLPEARTDAEVEALAGEWTQRSDVALAEPDRIRRATQTPNDPQFGNQWDMKAPTAGSYGANLPLAWDVTTGSSAVTVAILDTGKTNHADLAGKFVGGYDFIGDVQVANDGGGRDSDPSDPGDWITSAENASGYFAGCGTSNSSWHGTHVSGTIGAATNNGVGVSGIAWGSKLIMGRVLGKCGGYDSDIIDALKWSAGLSVSGVPANPNPAQVISLSLGGSGACSSAWQTAINSVVAQGTTIVIAAGNENSNASTASPGNCANVITVAATGPTGSRAYYSNYGSLVEIAAPGGDSSLGNTILSTLNAGTTTPGADSYAYYQGTSMATPHVAGVAALIKSVKPSATPAQVLAYLQGNVTPFPAGSSCTTSTCGSGILNANAAVRAAASTPGAPTIGSATGGNGQATVNWTAPASDGGSAITGYVVTPYIGASAQTAQTFNSTATTQTVTGLTNGTVYTFKVAAINALGTGTQSAASNAVTPAAPASAPGAPTIGSATGGNGQATVNWTAPASDGGSAITGYVVTPYIGASAQTAQTFNSTATTQTVTGLTNGTAYTFKVAAINAQGTGATSAASNAVTPSTVPGAPTGVSAVAGDASATVDWTAPGSDGGSAITGYVVTPYIGASAQTPQTFDSTATSQTVTGLTNGTAYTFTVAAVNANGTGSASAASTAVTPTAPTTVPGAPTIGTAVAGNGQATLSWTAPGSDGGSAITGYVVTPYVGATAWPAQTFNSPATTQTIGGLTNGTSYTFKVAAVNAVGTGSPSSASNAVTPSGTWFLRNANSSGSSIGGFPYGSPGDIAIAGDWDGNGTTTIGLYRPSTSTFYLRNANSSGSSIGGFGFGSPGDIPLAGDWDGDGVTTIGVYRPSTSTFYLRNANSSGSSIGGFGFGSSGDVPLAGDWDGNGTTTIGVYRPSTSTFYLRNANSSGSSIGGFAFGSTGDTPLAGDWDGNGTTTVGVYRPSTSYWYLRNANSSGSSIGGFGFGSPGDRPVTGDWDGIGGDTIGVFR